MQFLAFHIGISIYQPTCRHINIDNVTECHLIFDYHLVVYSSVSRNLRFYANNYAPPCLQYSMLVPAHARVIHYKSTRPCLRKFSHLRSTRCSVRYHRSFARMKLLAYLSIILLGLHLATASMYDNYEAFVPLVKRLLNLYSSSAVFFAHPTTVRKEIDGRNSEKPPYLKIRFRVKSRMLATPCFLRLGKGQGVIHFPVV